MLIEREVYRPRLGSKRQTRHGKLEHASTPYARSMRSGASCSHLRLYSPCTTLSSARRACMRCCRVLELACMQLRPHVWWHGAWVGSGTRVGVCLDCVPVCVSTSLEARAMLRVRTSWIVYISSNIDLYMHTSLHRVENHSVCVCVCVLDAFCRYRSSIRIFYMGYPLDN